MLKPVRRINTETGQAPQPLLSLNKKGLWLIAVKYCRNASICDGSDMCATAQFFFWKGGGGRTGLVVRALDSGSGDPVSILGRVGVLFP